MASIGKCYMDLVAAVINSAVTDFLNARKQLIRLKERYSDPELVSKYDKKKLASDRSAEMAAYRHLEFNRNFFLSERYTLFAEMVGLNHDGSMIVERLEALTWDKDEKCWRYKGRKVTGIKEGEDDAEYDELSPDEEEMYEDPDFNQDGIIDLYYPKEYIVPMPPEEDASDEEKKTDEGKKKPGKKKGRKSKKEKETVKEAENV